MTMIDNPDTLLSQAIGYVRTGDADSLAKMYIMGFDIKEHHRILMCWATESGKDNIVMWLNSILHGI
jgi:hypothetical protein